MVWFLGGSVFRLFCRLALRKPPGIKFRYKMCRRFKVDLHAPGEEFKIIG